MNETNLSKYLTQMCLVKKRQEVITNILQKRATTGFRCSDVEICVLQFRKIIELIAMGSLVANSEQYSAIYDKYASAWNARLIFRDIGRINSKFYPEPIYIDKSNSVDEFKPLQESYLTKEDAINIYEKCNGFLHENNPFRPEHDLEFFEQSLPVWHAKTVRLLNRHIINLCDGTIFVVFMKGEGTGQPVGSLFEQVNHQISVNI